MKNIFPDNNSLFVVPPEPIDENEFTSGHCFVKVDIYFTAVGMICIPTEEEIMAMMDEARNNPQEYSIVA